MADDANKPADKSSTPPWGDDFDAEKAWTLIQNLREENKGLKSERTSLKSERDELATKVEAHENAGKSEEEKRAAAEQKAAADLSAARRELFVERALRKHSIPEELVEFLTGDDEEAILAKAEKLASLGSKSANDPDAKNDDADKGDDDKGDEGTRSSRPKPGLQPGHGGDDPEPVDLDDIVSSIRS